MANIIFRHYREGDETQLANLFNKAFQQNGLGFGRTPKNWLWRYVRSPGFEPEMCQIAEDIDNNTIVGAVYANPIEITPLRNKKYLIGDINDVSCLPNYTRRGIATSLLKLAINYMKTKGCDYSMLSTGYNGLARKKIYKKCGFYDFNEEFLFIQFPNILQLVKNVIGLVFLLPVFFTISYLPRFLYRIRLKSTHFFSDFTYEINNNFKHREYMKAVNKIFSKFYEGFPRYDKVKFKWARVEVPSDRETPTYILIKKAGRTIGGGVITHQNLYSFKHKIKIRTGILHEVFLDKFEFKNKRDLHLGYKYLIDKILRAATQRSLGLLIYHSTVNDTDLNRAFTELGFLKIKGEVIMINELRENLMFPKITKPLYIPTHTSTGFP